VRHINPRHRVVGEQFHHPAVRAGFQRAPQAQAGNGTPVSTRVHQDVDRRVMLAIGDGHLALSSVPLSCGAEDWH
jgi:hypothetical protein